MSLLKIFLNCPSVPDEYLVNVHQGRKRGEGIIVVYHFAEILLGNRKKEYG